MNLAYGGYQHDVGDAEISISRTGMIGDLGKMYAVRERWDVNGRLHSDTNINAAVLALMMAYSVNRQDIQIVGSDHIMRSSDTINGTRVVVPPSFPKGNDGQLTTYRDYNLAVEGEFAYSGEGVLISWNETLSFKGTGGPNWGFLECLNGPPQMQVFTVASVIHATQSGSAVYMPPTTHRNDYVPYWQPPLPIWPQWEHQDQREIIYALPADLFGRKESHWNFVFSAPIPLEAYPNATGGIIMHLG